MMSVADIVCYPVKGLSGQSLPAADLVPGAGLPGDRRYALAGASTRFDPEETPWLPKTSFLMLMRHEKLASIQTHYDDGTGILVIRRDGRDVLRANLTTPIGRSLVEQFFDAFMKREIAGKPKLVAAPPGGALTDEPDPQLSIVNLASVADLERVVRASVDPRRFRANVYLQGAEAWCERGWVGRELRAGAARLRVVAAIQRCAATNVNPASGVRDMNLPKALMRGYGHAEVGVYAKVVAGGRLAAGDPVEAD